MIEVLLFAVVKEQIGASRLQLNYSGLTVRDVKQTLEDDYGLKDTTNLMMAVNEEYAGDDVQLQAGDTVAVIPPVSGG
ncbi:molybdopterin converting factor subunit 1 [Tuberibacillus sp. Marseille-P3662]|uniref:molybdopterin converting factor subunit 1 n=1 Tax=Tuberibacillus sp. Marseille-P3662 TaxID=1965358 RepID=UPI000A1CA7B1|nr:molybdopterin converting factor subunit 1 [Tuberibacillus sp. Marseille-P3662]